MVLFSARPWDVEWRAFEVVVWLGLVVCMWWFDVVVRLVGFSLLRRDFEYYFWVIFVFGGYGYYE